jgi:hypothetical protein
MTWVAVAIGGSALLGYFGSREQSKAATSAAELQSQAAKTAQDQQLQMFNIQNQQQAPYREAGYGALNKINTMLPQFTEMPSAYKPFTAADLQSNLAPNYEFMKQQGLGATAQGANVSSPGSNVDIAKTKFAEDYASNAYQNAVNNYMQQQQQGFNQQQAATGNIYNRLSSLAGIGQAAQNQSQALGVSTAGNIGQLGIGGASALGAGQINAANAQAGGLQGIGNAGFLYSMLSPSNASNVSGSNFMRQFNAISPTGS